MALHPPWLLYPRLNQPETVTPGKPSCIPLLVSITLGQMPQQASVTQSEQIRENTGQFKEILVDNLAEIRQLVMAEPKFTPTSELTLTVYSSVTGLAFSSPMQNFLSSTLLGPKFHETPSPVVY
ncbi:hypothetical protein H920_11217 [Fukomys damarensis]|uniref:Uncharacterized protein n=1 Tax=Fukomys damarensis TaxID=885580 RepID=A0A091DX63_FUKDA|nr:hypothetical protein H920_11217 [Fukomys damarensis]